MSQSTPDNFDRLAELIDATTRETITPDEGNELVDLLRADAAARRYYIEAVDMETTLRRKYDTKPLAVSYQPLASRERSAAIDQRSASSESQLPRSASSLASSAAVPCSSPLTPQPSRKSLLNWASRHPKGPAIAIAATLLVAALVVMGLVPVKEWVAGGKAKPEEQESGVKEDFVARLSNWQNDVWLEDTRPPLDDPRLNIGRRLKIESGLIEVTYLTGARVVIEGPAEFWVGGESISGKPRVESGKEDGRNSIPRPSSLTPNPSNAGATEPAERARRKGEGGSFDAENSGYLRRGKLVARVKGEKAKGFAIDTPSARIQDFGTEFGVEVLESGAARFSVLSGEVDVVSKRSDEEFRQSVRLSKGHGAFVAASGGEIEKEADVEGQSFVALRNRWAAIRSRPLNLTTITLGDWNRDGALDGWQVANATFSVEGGMLRGIGNDDCMITNNATSIDADVLKLVEVRLKTSGSYAELFWAKGGLFRADQRLDLGSGDGTFRTLLIDLSSEPTWKGTGMKLRVDPVSGIGPTFEIDYVRMHSFAKIDESWTRLGETRPGVLVYELEEDGDIETNLEGAPDDLSVRRALNTRPDETKSKRKDANKEVVLIR